MSTKPFKDIEEVIKNAAEGYEPPFEEAAWSKMEVLLGKEKDRRKPIFWWWLLLPVLIAGSVGGYFVFNNEQDKNKLAGNIVAEKREGLPSPAADKKGNPMLDKSLRAPVSDEPAEPNTGMDYRPSPGSKSMSVSTKIAASKNVYTGIPGADDANSLAGKSTVSDKLNNKTTVSIQSSAAEGDSEPLAKNKNQDESVTKTPIEQLKGNPVPIGLGRNKTSEPPASTEEKDKVFPPVNSAAPKQKSGKTTASRTYFIASGGVAGSGVNLFSVDKITAAGGVTIGYQLNKKWSVQTGFFAGSKKYVAGPGDYNPKDGSYWSTVDITSVDANCLVYEIPLNARYDFKPGKRLNVFASGGLSSYIMKKEEYQYKYNRNGYPHYGEAAYKGNQHLFSVLKLSAGVEKNISKKMALHAAPSFSIPLAGVGEGQVKLYSTDLLIGLRYQPFKKIKHK